MRPTKPARDFYVKLFTDRVLGRADSAQHTGRGRHRRPGKLGHGRRYHKVAVPVHRETRAESALETQGQPAHSDPIGRNQGTKTRCVTKLLRKFRPC